MADRETLIELLLVEFKVQGFLPPYGTICSIAEDLIANGVTVQEWISVKDRLPEKGTGNVLVVKQFRGKPYVDIGEVIGGNACCYADEYTINPREHIFTHWMPLPQPPKGE